MDPTPRRRTVQRLLSAVGLVAAVLCSSLLHAQTAGTVQGIVTDASTQRPMADVQVFVPAVNRGVVTGVDGRYRLVNVPAGPTQVRFQRIGYTPVTRTVGVAAGEPARLDVEMSASTIALDEIVVTGAGVATERRKLGNTVATIDAAQVARTAPVVNVSEVLQAREPGVVGLSSSGTTGEGSRIRIRGLASIMQSNEPVVYVDGVRVDASGGLGMQPGQAGGGGGSPSRLDDINPESIERIEILKGAAAATLFGTQASNGVIQIFTKQGRTGEPRYDLRIEQGMSRFPNVYPKLAGFVTAQGANTRDMGVAGVKERWGLDVQPYQAFEVDAIPDIWETGRHQTYSLSTSGGSQLVTYYVSGRWTAEDGPLGGQDLAEPGFKIARDYIDRRQANANLTLLPREDVSFRITSSFVETHFEAPETNNNIYGVFPSILMSHPEKAHAKNLYGSGAFTTTRESLHRLTEQDVQRFGGSVGANYTLSKDLKFDATVGLDVVSQYSVRFQPFGWNVDGLAQADARGNRIVADRNRRELTLETKGSWNTEFGPFTSALVVGAQGFLTRTGISSGTGNAFPGPGLEVTGAGAIQTVWENFVEEVNTGAMFQEQIGFRDYLFLTVGARYDKHSAFGQSAGGAFYPKASLSLVPSDLPGWDSELLSTLRFRTAIGRSGLQPSAFAKYTTFSPLAAETGPGVAPLNLGNADIKPEVSTEWEAGAELGLFSNRISVEATYWNRTVDDLLIDRQFPPSGGFRFPQLDNIGQMRAQGVELGTRGILFSNSHVTVDLLASASYTHEKVTDMGDAPPLKVGGQYQRYRGFVREGYAPGAFFGPMLVNGAQYPINLNNSCKESSRADLLAYFSQPRAPEAIHPLIVDCDKGTRLLQYIGKPLPDWQGSFGANVGFLKSFQLNSLFEYRGGNYYVHDLSSAFRRTHAVIGRNIRKAAEVEATLRNPASTAEQRLEAANVWVRELVGLSPYDGLNEIHKADWVRLRELSLTYNVPQNLASRIGARTMSVTTSGRNLALWTKYPGPDPEENAHGRGGGAEANTGSTGTLNENVGEGTAAFGFPVPRRFTFAINLGF